MKIYFTIREIANVFKISPQSLYDWIVRFEVQIYRKRKIKVDIDGLQKLIRIHFLKKDGYIRSKIRRQLIMRGWE